MFESFTPESGQAIKDARIIAAALGQDVIGTEHLLAAVAKQTGPAQQVLTQLDLGADAIIAQLPIGDAQLSGGKLPFTLDAKAALEYALREALGMGQNFIAPYHLLLGLCRIERDAGAPAILDGALGTGAAHGRRAAIYDPLVQLLNAQHQTSRTDIDRRTSTVRRHHERLRKLIKHTGNADLVRALEELSRLAVTPIGEDAGDQLAEAG